MKYCDFCQQLIQPGEVYKAFDRHSLSGAGGTAHWHERICVDQDGRPIPAEDGRTEGEPSRHP